MDSVEDYFHQDGDGAKDKKTSRRDFLILTTQSVSALGALSLVGLGTSLGPAADTLSRSSTELDVSSILPGQMVKISWRGKPVFIKHRTAKEIKEAQNIDIKSLPDPQLDTDRVMVGREQWLIVIGVCTHLGCVPTGNAGDYEGGFFCPCHGSHYDSSGRVRKGPAPENLQVPEYEFLTDSLIKIGK